MVYNDQKYYKVHINESQSIVYIPVAEEYFDRENAILIPFEAVES